MLRLKTSSLRTRLKLVIMLVSFVSVALVFAGLSIFESITFKDVLVNDITTKADIIADNSTAALAFRDSADALRILESLGSQRYMVTAALYDSRGDLFVAYERPDVKGSIPAVPAGNGWSFDDKSLFVYTPVILDGAFIGTLFLRRDIVALDERSQSFIQIALLVLLGSLVAAFYIATLLERKISGPILELAETAKQVSVAQDYSVRAKKISRDETGYLADTINQMLSRIQQHDTSLQQSNKNLTAEIAERKRIGEALRVAEGQLRLITETTPLILTRCNHAQEYLYVNRAFTETLNLDAGEIIGTSVERIVGPGVYASLSPHIQTVLAGIPVEFEVEVQFQKTGRRFLRVAYMPETNEQGDVVGWVESTSDITAAKEAHLALHESEERFRQFMSNLPGAAWIKDQEGRYVYANEEACRIFNASRPELYGKTDDEVFPPETAQQFKENDRKAIEHRRSEQVIETMQQLDGLHHSIVTKFPVFGREDKPMLIGGVAIDITERVRAEQALHESEERARVALSKLAAIVESSQDAIIGKSLEGTVTSWNEGAETILGYSADEVIGHQITEIVPAALHEEEERTLARLRNGERIDPFDTVRIAKGGREVQMSLTLSPIRDNSGHIVGISTIARDISERRRAELKLRESEQRYRNLILAMPVALYTTDRGGVITLYNEPAAELWGRRPEIGKDMWCGSWKIYTVDGTSVPLDECPMARTLKEGRSIRGEEMLVERPDGSRSCIIPHPDPLYDSSGQLTGAINMLVDITQRKQAEEELRRAHHELESRVRERTSALTAANEELLKREMQLSTAQMIAHLGSWEMDVSTSRVSWSDELYRIYGLQQGEFGETLDSFLGLLHPDDRSRTLAYVQEAMRTHAPFEFEERIIRPDGSIRTLQTQGRVVTDSAGNVVSLMGVCLDVTERRLAEQKFRDLVESAPDAMVITDAKGCIVLVNVQTEILFGYSRSELFGRPVTMLLPFGSDGNRKGHPPGSNSRSRGDQEYGRRKDRSEFPVEINSASLETADGTMLSRAIRDITEQQQLRAQLLETERRRSEDLRTYVRSVQRVQEEERQRIARDLHDDICQRLTGMKMSVEVIADEFSTKDRSLYRKLRSFNRQCESAISEVRRMSVNLRPSVLDDFGLVTALGLLTREFEKQHSIRVVMETEPGERLQLEPHKEIALYRIAQEALSNIAKYARASQVTISLHTDESGIAFRVNDNGNGFNVKAARSQRGSHSGLGLISMKERTELLGGNFNIQSNIGGGTTITVNLPTTIGIINEENALTHS